MDYLERFGPFLTANSSPINKEAQVFLNNQTTVTYKSLSNLVAQQSLVKGINNLSKDNPQMFMEEQFDPRRFVVREKYKFWSDL